jgi:hypothetical protein
MTTPKDPVVRILRIILSKLNSILSVDFYDYLAALTFFVSTRVLPILFAIGNYFQLVQKSEWKKPKGLLYMITSIVYASFTIYLNWKKPQ